MEEKRILRSLCAGVFVLICSCVFAANPTVVLYQAAILEADRGNIIGAEADLRHAIDLIRSPSQKATFLLKIAELHEDAGNYDRALEVYKELAQYEGSNEGCHRLCMVKPEFC